MGLFILFLKMMNELKTFCFLSAYYGCKALFQFENFLFFDSHYGKVL